MLEKLVIRNFQKHRKRVIEFDPLITTFTGPSESGKTAIMRALRWVMTNQPSGDAFISHGAEYAQGKLYLDGHSITRRRGDKNLYKLDREEYVSFGQSVPDDIARLLNISPLNFHQQHDAPFWLFETPGTISRELNSIVALGAIDDALSSIASDLRQAKAVVSVTRDRLEKAQRRKDELAWIQEYDEHLYTCEQLYTDWQGVLQESLRVAQIVDNVESLTERIKTASSYVLCVSRLLQLGQDAIEKQQEMDELEELIQNTVQADRMARQPLPDLSRLEELKRQAEEKDEEWSELEKIVRHMNLYGKRLEQMQAEAKEAEKELAEMTEGEACPVCGKEF